MPRKPRVSSTIRHIESFAASTRASDVLPPQPKGDERRRRRSSSPLTAARYYFENLLRRQRAPRAVVLSDGAQPLAGTGDVELSRLAAYGAACVSPADDAQSFPELEKEDVFAHSLLYQGRKLVLTSLGERVPTVRGIERDVQRILSGAA